MRLALLVASVVLSLSAATRDRATRQQQELVPPLDEQTLASVTLGESIEVKPGESRTLSIYKWECCVYPVTVRANVRYSADASTAFELTPDGYLTISRLAPAGLTFRIYGSVDGGRRIISTEVIVVTPDAFPLRGYWSQTQTLHCDGSAGPADNPIQELAFHANGRFSVTWFPFEVYKDYWGFYSAGLPGSGHLSMAMQGGNYMPSGFRGDGTYSIRKREDGSRELTIHGVTFGADPMHKDSQQPADCGGVFIGGRA